MVGQFSGGWGVFLGDNFPGGNIQGVIFPGVFSQRAFFLEPFQEITGNNFNIYRPFQNIMGRSCMPTHLFYLFRMFNFINKRMITASRGCSSSNKINNKKVIYDGALLQK